MMSERALLNYVSFSTPIGRIALCASSRGICRIDFCGNAIPSLESMLERMQMLFASFDVDAGAHRALLNATKSAILQYFSEHIPLPETPLDISAGTPFQQAVWQALCHIPFGETRAYLDIARSIGKPNAARAVGGACATNPIPLIIPCHRVITSGGQLGGYSGGLDIKKMLLKLENAEFNP